MQIFVDGIEICQRMFFVWSIYNISNHSLLIQAESLYHIAIRQFMSDIRRYGFFKCPYA